MYSRDKKPYYSHQTPSFSSTLLDSIYRSIDDGKAEDWMISRAKISKASDISEDFRRARLVDKWIRKETDVRRPPAPENDMLFFSSTSTSSDSSGSLSSSSKEDEIMMKSKSRALKIYARLKKMKQPISPGGRLTSFINSLFSLNGKKQQAKFAEDPKTLNVGSSFSRSCLSKNSRRDGGGGVRRTVRFHPVSLILDEDSRPCGHKSIYVRNEKNMNNGDDSINALRSYYKAFEEDDEDDDSDSSSDLFELDHLTLFGDTRFCQELPVYETTHFNNNRSFVY